MSVPVFPTLKGLTYPFKRTARWSTDMQDALSGKRVRFQRFSYPIFDYEAQFSFLRADSVNAEFQSLMAFYNKQQGPTLLFQYTDPVDNTATTNGFGTGDGLTTAFQLVSNFGGFAYPVFLTTGTPQIFDNAVLKATPADYTISAYGVVNWVVAPVAGHALTWTGTYNFPCRFSADDQPFTQEQFGVKGQPIWTCGSMKFSSEKLP